MSIPAQTVQVATASQAGTSASTFNVTLPASPTAGNLLLLYVGAGTEVGSGTWTPPSGFTLIDYNVALLNNAVAYDFIGVAYRVVQAGDSATVAVTANPYLPWASVVNSWTILKEIKGQLGSSYILNHSWYSSSSGSDFTGTFTPNAYPAWVDTCVAMGEAGPNGAASPIWTNYQVGATASPIPVGFDALTQVGYTNYFTGASYSVQVPSGNAVCDISNPELYSFWTGWLGVAVGIGIQEIANAPLSTYDSYVINDGTSTAKAYWPMSDTSAITSGKVLDRSGNGYHMAASGSAPNGAVIVAQPSLIPSAPSQSSILMGMNATYGPQSGGAAWLLSTYTPTAINAMSLECTLSAIHGTSGVSVDEIGCQTTYSGVVASGAGFRFSLNNDGSLGFLLSNGLGLIEGCVAATGIAIATHHCVCTWNGSTGAAYVYIDGVSVGTVTQTFPTGPITATGALSVADYPAGYAAREFPIAGLGIYESVLTPTQVTAHYTVWLSGISAPSAPVLSGTPGVTQNILTWTTPAGSPTGYSLLRGLTTGGESLTPIYTGSANGYTDTGLTNGTTYYYEVYASNSAGNSGNSNEVSLTPTNLTGGLPLLPPVKAQADVNMTRTYVTTGYPIAWGPQSFGRGRSGTK
jgi:hypothetical protein